MRAGFLKLLSEVARHQRNSCSSNNINGFTEVEGHRHIIRLPMGVIFFFFSLYCMSCNYDKVIWSSAHFVISFYVNQCMFMSKRNNKKRCYLKKKITGLFKPLNTFIQNICAFVQNITFIHGLRIL